MEQLKFGSTGATVKVLQKALNISADGIFGKNTEKAVKDFQLKNNLVVDGIVGDNTWKALNITETTKAIFKDVVYSPLYVHMTENPLQRKYIVIHYPACSSSKEGSALSIKNNVFTKRIASADFVIDDKTILQLNPDFNKYYSWHCGDDKYKYSKGGKLYGKCLNRNSIGIEICCNCKKGCTTGVVNHDGWYYTDEVLKLAVKLIKQLMVKFNIPLSNVIRHYDVTGKPCPGLINWNDEQINESKTGKKIPGLRGDSSEWIKFKRMLEE